MPKKPYNHIAADELEDFVMKYFGPHMKPADRHVYWGLRRLERAAKGRGLCEPIAANVRQIGAASGVDKDTATLALQRLSSPPLRLILYEPGPQGRSKLATMVRRRTIEEIKTHTDKKLLESLVPADAKRLERLLNGVIFHYDGKEQRLRVNAAMNGRIMYWKPAICREQKKARITKLLKGLQEPEVLVEVDFEEAEPTIIKAVLNNEGYLSLDEWPKEGVYQLVATQMGWDREKAKEVVNALAYAPNSEKRAKLEPEWVYGDRDGSKEAIWRVPFVKKYARALDQYKAELMRFSKKPTRYVFTLGGTKITQPRGDTRRFHRGRLLAWRVQGTLADIVNSSALEILETQAGQGCLLAMVGDALFVSVTDPKKAKVVQRIMEQQAEKLKLPLRVKVRTYPATRKPETTKDGSRRTSAIRASIMERDVIDVRRKELAKVKQTKVEDVDDDDVRLYE